MYSYLNLKKYNVSTIICFALLVAWCFLSAASRVLGSYIGQVIDPFLLGLFLIFFSSTFFFSINLRKINLNFLKKCKFSIKEFLLINFSTFCTWFFIFYPLKYIDPALASTITLGIGPVLTLCFNWIYGRQSYSKQEYLVSLAILALIVFIFISCVEGKTGVPIASIKYILIAVCCSVIVGASVVTTTISVKRLHLKGFTTLDIILMRFFLLFFISIILIGCYPQAFLMMYQHLFYIILLSFMMIIIPTWMLFYSIKRLEPFTVAIIITLMPALIFHMEFFYGRFYPNILTFYCVTAFIILTIMGITVRFRSEKKAQQQLGSV